MLVLVPGTRVLRVIYGLAVHGDGVRGNATALCRSALPLVAARVFTRAWTSLEQALPTHGAASSLSLLLSLASRATALWLEMLSTRMCLSGVRGSGVSMRTAPSRGSLALAAAMSFAADFSNVCPSPCQVLKRSSAAASSDSRAYSSIRGIVTSCASAESVMSTRSLYCSCLAGECSQLACSLPARSAHPCGCWRACGYVLCWGCRCFPPEECYAACSLARGCAMPPSPPKFSMKYGPS